MKAMLSRITLGRASLATICLGLTTLLATHLVPPAQAQDDQPPVQAGVNQTCVTVANPCGGSCAGGDTSECFPSLNGWRWGACGLPANKVKPCTNYAYPGASCGSEYDCLDNFLGPCSLGPFPACTQS